MSEPKEWNEKEITMRIRVNNKIILEKPYNDGTFLSMDFLYKDKRLTAALNEEYFLNYSANVHNVKLISE